VSKLGLSGSSLVVTLNSGAQLSQDLSTLMGGGSGSGAKTISMVGIDPVHTTQLLITYSDGTTTTADLSSLSECPRWAFSLPRSAFA
jgi:hypothetical protein